MMIASRTRIALLATVLALALTACTIEFRPGASIDVGVSLDNVITDFRPSRGVGATYFVGDNIVFSIRTRESGYITLTALDPDGRVYVFSRNIYVPGGRTVSIPTRDMRVVFTAAAPRGFQRVRASFTNSPTDTGRVTYRGRHGAGQWSSAIEVDIRGSTIRDIAETNLVIR